MYGFLLHCDFWLPSDPFTFDSTRERKTTVMIVGKSGAGKSTLGNQLLNLANGSEDDEDFKPFTEGDGTEGQTCEVEHHESKDGTFRVIDTPGIPDPNNVNTLNYFDAIVEEIRRVDDICLIIFLGHQDRVNPKEFRDYRTLLRQFNLVSCGTLLVCRQAEYNRRPTKQMKEDKRDGGLAWVEDVFENSGLRMEHVLWMSGYSEEACQSLENIADIARGSPPAGPMAPGTLRTYPELKAVVKMLSEEHTRLPALEEELVILSTSLESKTTWAGYLHRRLAYAGFFVDATFKTLSEGGSLGHAGVKLELAYRQLQRSLHDPEIVAKIKAVKMEIKSGRVEADGLERAREDLRELEALTAY